MQPYVIGIDIGTGSTKGVAYATDGAVSATAQVFYHPMPAAPGIVEQDPHALWDAFIQCLVQLTRQMGYAPAAISLSSYMHSLMAVNTDGTPLTPVITWADRRSEKAAAALRLSAHAAALYTTTGTPIHSMSPLCKLIWFQQNHPELISTAAKWIGVKEYIWYRLFRVFEIDHSLASATGLFDIKLLQWHPVSLQLCGVNVQQLSQLVPTSYTRNGMDSATAGLLHIDATTPFCIGASDGCLANVGSGATGKGIAAVTIGTSGAVRVASAAPVHHFPAMTFNYILDKDTFICGGPVNNGGNVVQWLLRRFCAIQEPTSADYSAFFETIASTPAGSKGLLFLPYLYGERAPHWNEGASGAFIGIQLQHEQRHFLRAALEGICFALRQVLELVEGGTGPVTQLNVSGGFIQSPVWVQLLANITGKPMCLLQTEDASAIGAALVGMKAANLKLPPVNSQQQLITPDAAQHQLYGPQYHIFKTLYPQLQQGMQLLSTLNQ